MAILTPSHLATTARQQPDGERIVTALQPWHRRLLTQRFVRWITRGSITGLLLASCLLLISRLVPWASVLFWALGLGTTCILLSLLIAWRYRPSLAMTARLVDTQLALHDRLGTAWELRQESSALASLQRRDTLAQLEKHTPTQALSLKLSRTAVIAAAIVTLAFVLLLVLPNPMTAVLKQQAAFQAHIAQQVQKIEQLRHELAQQATTPDAKKQQQAIDQILSDLQKQLAQAKNDTQAQQAIAQAQAKLDQLRNPLTANRSAAQAAASSSLQNSANPNLSAVGNALANSDPKALADALQKLAAQASKLTPAQRSQLAQQLEKAANAASNNANLSSSLHQLAKSLADGSQSEINDAANAVQSAANQDAAAQSQQNTLNQTSQQLQQTANNLTASTDNTNNPGNATQQGQTQNQGQGQQGQGQGQQGQGQSQTQGQGQGQTPGQGQGQGKGQGQGGQGQGGQGGNNGAGNQQGKNEQVYVPGQTGTGTSTQTNGGNNGVVQSGNAIPYSQVIQEYDQMAHDAIDNSNVSPTMKDLVHDYFNSLEQGK